MGGDGVGAQHALGNQPHGGDKSQGKKKQKCDFLLVVLLYGVFVSNMNNSQVSAFLPQFAEEKHDAPESVIGVIFAFYSVGVFLCSLVIGSRMNKRGVKKIFLITGLCVMAVSNAAFVFLEYVDNKYAFFVLATVVRTVMGAGQALFMTPAYSIVPVLYRDTLEEKIGYMEAMAGFGLGLGPLFGGLLYSAGGEHFGYAFPFVFCAVLSLLPVPFCFKAIPAQFKEKASAYAQEFILGGGQVANFQRLDDDSMFFGPKKQRIQQDSEYAPSEQQNGSLLEQHRLAAHNDAQAEVSPSLQPHENAQDGVQHAHEGTDGNLRDEHARATDGEKGIPEAHSPESVQNLIPLENQIVVHHEPLVDDTDDALKKGGGGEGQLDTEKNAGNALGDDNQEDDDDDEDDDEEDDDETLEVNYRLLLSNKYIFFAYFIVVLNNINILFLDPTLGPYLDELGVPPSIVGIVFSAGALVYILCCPLGSFFARKSNSFKVLLFIGCLIGGAGMILIGPNHLLTRLPRRKAFPYVGEAILSVGNIFVFIPVIPEMIDSLKRAYPEMPEEVIGDISSALFNSAFSLGAFIGPLIGGGLSQAIGFQNASALLGLILIVFGVLYAVFGGALSVKKLRVTSSASGTHHHRDGKSDNTHTDDDKNLERLLQGDGGLQQAAVASLPGASQMFRHSFKTYSIRRQSRVGSRASHSRHRYTPESKGMSPGGEESFDNRESQLDMSFDTDRGTLVYETRGNSMRIASFTRRGRRSNAGSFTASDADYAALLAVRRQLGATDGKGMHPVASDGAQKRVAPSNTMRHQH